MASKIWRDLVSIEDSLYNEPWRFEFFQAVRLLHLIHRNSNTSETIDPMPESIVTYKSHLSLNFPASEIQDLQSSVQQDIIGTRKPPTMIVNFMGLTGPSGVLPRHYTEFLLNRKVRYKDETAQAFFDLFNHRAIALFVEAWEKYRFYIDYERGQSQRSLRYLLDLIGMGTTGLQGQLKQKEQGIQDEMLAYYCGLNAQRPHSAVALSAILQDYFKIKVEILQFQGQWLQLEPEQCTRIGRKKGTYQKLGESAVIGRFVWDCQSKFRVRIGPMKKSIFDDYLPTGNAFVALKKFVDWYKPLGQNFDVQLVLRKEEIPKCCLGDKGSARLGWSTWLTHQSPLHDADDVVLTC